MSTTIIDDHDTAVTYSGNWVSGGIPKEYGGTVMSSTRVGDKFTVQFNGSSIAVYATLDALSSGVVTSYSIDGGTVAQATAPSVTSDMYKQKVWTSPNLTDGNHTLDVTMVKVNKEQVDGEGTIWFDYFAVTHGDATSPSATTGLASSTATGETSASATGTNTNTSAAASGTAKTDTKAAESNNHSGAVVGGVIAAAVVVFLLLILVFHRSKRKKMGGAEKFDPFFSNPPHAKLPHTAQTRKSAYPFVAPGASPHKIKGQSRPHNSPPHKIKGQDRPHNPPPPPISKRPPAPEPSVPTRGTLATGATPDDPNSISEHNRPRQEDNAGITQDTDEHVGMPQVVQHVDSGIRGAAAGPLVELPPVYTPA